MIMQAGTKGMHGSAWHAATAVNVLLVCSFQCAVLFGWQQGEALLVY
jgi:hypothetical protein